VNDDRIKPAYGSRTDAYEVFRTMVNNGNPPNDWTALVKAYAPPSARRQAGALRNEIKTAPNIDILPPDILAAIEGEDE
jgi:hypothetical protein